MVAILGSVQNDVRVSKVLKKFGVQTVYHAAAYKHVPMVEYNISEGIINNIIGTKTMVEECHYQGVETFVLVSTDKAVRPTNIMGASKRIAELLVQGMAANRYGSTTFSMVRFGNVLGSSGSVVPTFLEQLSRREALTVTHKDITRYFMSIPEAAQLVIQAGAMADGGEVFVLDMGEPVKIYDLAQKMIDWYDDPWGESIEITGLRPGEKLYEELLIGDDVSKTEHPMICKANEEFMDYEKLRQDINYLSILCDCDKYDTVVEWMKEIIPGFNHSGEIKDYLS
jgi:FlaA1/EpsC-like NDP-sugar epimerase